MSIDWKNVRRVLLVRLRSIGDTVLATPSLIALKRFLPDAQIDILLEDWCAPVLDGFDAVDNIVTVGKSGKSRFRTLWQIRKAKYDVVFNLHGGTTGTFFTFASGAQHRVGYGHYQYRFLYNHLLSSSADFWGRPVTHSVEQQLALLGYVGVPVDDRPKSQLVVTETALNSLEEKFHAKTQSTQGEFGRFALLHPTAAFPAKQWPVKNFAETAEFLTEGRFAIVAVASRTEAGVLEMLTAQAKVPVVAFDDLTLPEITALASKASIFVGNDSGIAHIAAAVGTPTVVIFGPSNVDHWRPWTDASNEVVVADFPDGSADISRVTIKQVTNAITRVLQKNEEAGDRPASSSSPRY